MMRGRHLKWAVVAGAGIALGGMAVFWAVAPRQALSDYRAALEAEGVRLTLEECVPPVVPEHHQSGMRFSVASQGLPRPASRGLIPPPGMRMVAPGKALVGWAQPTIISYGDTGESWEDLAEWLRQAEPQLRQIREISLKATFHWNLDWSQGMMMPLPHLNHLKSAAQWLAADLALALREGRLDHAIEAQITQLRLVHALREEGPLIGQLVRIAMAGIAWGGTWELLQRDGWSDSQLASLQAAWESVEFVDAMTRGLETERAMGLFEYERVRRSPGLLRGYLDLNLGALGLGGGLAGGGPEATRWLPHLLELAEERFIALRHGSRARMWAVFHSYADERFYIEALEGMLRTARERTAALATAAGQPVRLEVGETFFPKLGDEEEERMERHLFASMILPPLDRAFEKAFLIQTQRELALTVLALHRHHLEQGRFPDALDELVPRFLAAVPTDWMDGSLLRYRVEEGGRFTLYSVGRDGRDDGGDPHPVLPQARGLYAARDLVWPEAATAD